MSELTVSISVEGLELATWEKEFRASLSGEPAAQGLEVVTVRGAGTLGARRSSAVKVKSAEGDGSLDAAVKMVGLILSALSLAIASAQLALKLQEQPGGTPDARPSITCTIDGPKGSRELRIDNAGVVPDSLLRDCLKDTGTPTRIKAKPNAGR